MRLVHRPTDESRSGREKTTRDTESRRLMKLAQGLTVFVVLFVILWRRLSDEE